MQFEYREMHISYLGATLFAVSLRHCKNVDVRPIDPPERLSRSHARKHGRPLVRYHVLDIQPMRRVLDREGEAQSKGLRHALPICRGHFKTYTAEAPLLGRHTGTFWWPAHVRGATERALSRRTTASVSMKDSDASIWRLTSTLRSLKLLQNTLGETLTWVAEDSAHTT